MRMLLPLDNASTIRCRVIAYGELKREKLAVCLSSTMSAAARSTYLLALVVALATAGCTSVPTTEDPVYLKLTDLEARLIRIERVIDNQSLIELSTQIDQLQAQAQALRGEVEALRYESNNGADRQRQLYVDVDSRLQTLEVAQA